MNRGYTRAYVDRAATRETGPIRFVAATEGRQADGIDLRMAGANLARYRANPIFGYGHSYWGRTNLPIGKATAVDIAGEGLLIDVEFDQGDEFAMEVERKYRDGYMNAVSIGFEVHEWESENDNYWRGGVATGWELLELSAVPIPMDANAVVSAGRSDVLFIDDPIGRPQLFTPAEVGRAVAELLRKYDVLTADAEVAPEPDDEVPTRGIDKDAAQALLAALTTPEGDKNE